MTAKTHNKAEPPAPAWPRGAGRTVQRLGGARGLGLTWAGPAPAPAGRPRGEPGAAVGRSPAASVGQRWEGRRGAGAARPCPRTPYRGDAFSEGRAGRATQRNEQQKWQEKRASRRGPGGYMQPAAPTLRAQGLEVLGSPPGRCCWLPRPGTATGRRDDGRGPKSDAKTDAAAWTRRGAEGHRPSETVPPRTRAHRGRRGPSCCRLCPGPGGRGRGPAGRAGGMAASSRGF